MTRPPETEKLLSCNLLRQKPCRHVQMIFSYVLHNSSHHPDQGAARKGKCRKNRLRSTGSTVDLEATSIAVGGEQFVGSRGSRPLRFEAMSERRIYGRKRIFLNC